MRQLFGLRSWRIPVMAALCGWVVSASARAQSDSLATEGTIYGKAFVSKGWDVKTVLPSRSDEPWFPFLFNPPLTELVLEPPSLRPEGLALMDGLLYASGDWNETQNQIAVISTNNWGDLLFDHAIEIPLSSPPPLTTPNNEYWGPEGMTFNTGAIGTGAEGNLLVTVDSEQAAVGGNTFATVDPTTGALANTGIVATPDDIAYGAATQQFFVKVPPNTIEVFDADMTPTGLSWTTPPRARGVAVVSAAYGQWLTGDNTLTGDVVLVVCKQDPDAIPPLVSRLVAYTSNGIQIGDVQDISWVDLSVENFSNSGKEIGPHEMEAIVVDEVNNTIYIADEAARGIYTIKPTSSATSTVCGPVFGQSWSARGEFVELGMGSRNGEPWFGTLAGQMNDPPKLRPEAMTLKDGALYVAGDWNETQNQIAKYQTGPGGSLTFAGSISCPVSNPPPNPQAPQNELWGPEGMTFNTSPSGYGSNGSAIITVEDEQFLLFGNTRGLLDPMTGALSGMGKFESFVGAASPDDIAFGPISTNLYVIADPNVLQVWTSAVPPQFTGTQFAISDRAKGLCVVSPAFAQFLLSNPLIDEETILVVAKSQFGSNAAPNNRLAAYSPTGILLGEQDMKWTRDALPGQPLQEFEAIAVDEANQVIYIGDEKAGGIFVLTIPEGLQFTTPPVLPVAAEGVAYNQSLETIGGTPPVNFALQSGSLPAGVTLSPTGVLSGAPTQCGTFSFVVEVTDSAVSPGVATETFFLSILPAGVLGDMDDDGLLSGGDIQRFVRARLGAGTDADQCSADMNADAAVNAADDPLFVAALLGI